MAPSLGMKLAQMNARPSGGMRRQDRPKGNPTSSGRLQELGCIDQRISDRTIEGARQHPERSAQHYCHNAGDTEPVGIAEPARLMRADTARKQQADADQQRHCTVMCTAMSLSSAMRTGHSHKASHDPMTATKRRRAFTASTPATRPRTAVEANRDRGCGSGVLGRRRDRRRCYE